MDKKRAKCASKISLPYTSAEEFDIYVYTHPLMTTSHLCHE